MPGGRLGLRVEGSFGFKAVRVHIGGGGGLEFYGLGIIPKQVY